MLDETNLIYRENRQRRPKLLERMTGIEPALSAWEAEVLPLNYIRVAAGKQRFHVSRWKAA